MPPGGPEPQTLHGREVAITGRLGSMTRPQAAAAIHRAAGRYTAEVGPATDFLVVGDDSLPIEHDGRLNRQLRRARELQRGGSALVVLSETELLHRLGVAPAPEPGQLFTTSQLGRMLGVPPGRLREWVRAGLLVPVKTLRQLAYFDFAQVTNARTLLTLTRGGATAAHIRRSLQQLRSWLPEAERSLHQLEVLERGAVLVRLEDGRLAEPSGQLRLPFERREPATCASLWDPPPPSSDALFEAGIAAEAEGRFEAAAEAYQGALLAGGPEAEIAFNLGNALYALGRRAEAVQRYQQALEIDPNYAGAWNNLGNALSDLGQLEPAARAYERSLQLDPSYADAYFNLGETCRQLGRLDDARRHWQSYLARDPHSDWARQVRARLDELSV